MTLRYFHHRTQGPQLLRCSVIRGLLGHQAKAKNGHYIITDGLGYQPSETDQQGLSGSVKFLPIGYRTKRGGVGVLLSMVVVVVVKLGKKPLAVASPAKQ